MERLSLAATSAPAAAASRVIAIVQAAGQRIGIDGAHVVQAVVVPDDLAAVPRRAGGIVGVMSHGQQLVPVVRLEDWLEAKDDEVDDDAPPALPAASPEARIVILNDGDHVVGLWVDAVIGMQRCPASAVARLFHDERPDELFAGAARVDAGSPALALLEPARLAKLAGVWCAAAGLSVDTVDARAQQASAAQDDVPADKISVGVFRIGDMFVGIDVADIGELLRTPVLRRPPMRHSSTRGLCDWRDRLLPVADIGGLLGAIDGGETPAWMCVVRHGDLVLGVLVHEIVSLHGADVPVAADADDRLVRRELPIERGMLQVLDTAALMAHCPESCISRRSDAQSAQAGLATNTHTYLVFEAGGGYAARIDGVQEIVPLPDALRPRLEAGLQVSLQWRGHAVPVRGLFDDAHATLPPADARLLLVVVAHGNRVAIPISGVKAMIAPRTATLARLRVRAEPVDVVSTIGAADRASYEVVELEARAVAEPALRQAA